MPKNVVLVGHCTPDSERIRVALEPYDIHVQGAGSVAEVFSLAHKQGIALIIGNRVIENDPLGGLHLVKQLKANFATHEIPVILLSAFEETQTLAQSMGALPGFSKDQLESRTARDLFNSILAQ